MTREQMMARVEMGVFAGVIDQQDISRVVNSIPSIGAELTDEQIKFIMNELVPHEQSSPSIPVSSPSC